MMNSPENKLQVSIIFPCYNEQKGLGKCISQAAHFLTLHHLSGEIIVIDNGSTDNSVEIAQQNDALVIIEERRGYGSACRRGLFVAQGEFVVLLDSDGSYNINEAISFIKYLQSGYDFVIGSRFKGRIFPGAMPRLHQFVGIPFLTKILNVRSNLCLSDAHCGMRAIRQGCLNRMNLQSRGMEFASEMILEVARLKLRTTEVGINYYPRMGTSKLNTFADGLRHLALILTYPYAVSIFE